MNRIRSWAGILMLFAVVARGAPPPSLLPAQAGNYWILESSLGDQKIIRCEPGPKKLLQITGLSERVDALYISGKFAKLYRWDSVKNKSRRIVKLRPGKKGQSKFSAGNSPCDQLLFELGPVAGTLRTTSGDYTNCSALAITTADPILPGVCNLLAEQIYFAPGIGPVAVQGKLGRLYLLVEAQVGDTLIGGQ